MTGQSKTAKFTKIIAGRYRVMGILGRGGMGTILHAFDEGTGRAVALKRALDRDVPGDHAPAAEMLQREYLTLVHLRHPSIVDVHDFGLDGDTPFYTMELLDGGDLSQQSPLPWRHACRMIRDVCSSLALMHSRLLLHRDVSPRNVRRAPDGRAKLMDFGNLAAMGMCQLVAGTVPLLAPEVLFAQPLDGRCDLYSLGGSLYFALTGKHAGRARRFRELRAVWERPLAPPSSVCADVPAALDDLVLSLLQLEAAARPQTAAEVIDRLTAIAELPSQADSDAVSAACLATPTLVGRDEPFERVRRALPSARAGHGSRIWVAGASGVGRRRVVDAAALKARLWGVVALRAGGSRAINGPERASAARTNNGLDRRMAPRTAGVRLLHPFAAVLEDEGVELEVLLRAADMLERQVRELRGRPMTPLLTERVRALIADDLAGSPVGLSELARQLDSSPSTLKRRLADEGTSYMGLLDDVRRTTALRLADQSHLKIGDIAYLTGYQDTTAFHRAFRRWTGTTPSQYRHRRADAMG